MNFKEALIAHLQGDHVESRSSQMDVPWQNFIEYHRNVQLYLIDDPDFASACEFRLKPRTITVNGREVQAGETVEPAGGTKVFIANPAQNEFHIAIHWWMESCFARWLERGLVHLTKEAAIAHARAMLNIPESTENEIYE